MGNKDYSDSPRKKPLSMWPTPAAGDVGKTVRKRRFRQGGTPLSKAAADFMGIMNGRIQMHAAMNEENDKTDWDGLTRQLGMIKTLRENTGARLTDCQKAIVATGSIEGATIWLRKQNLAHSQTSTRTTSFANEGLIGVLEGDGVLAVVELTASTDFVTKNQEFRDLLGKLTAIVMDSKAKPEDLLGEVTGLTSTIVNELAGKTGESIKIKNALRLEGKWGYYLHSDYKQFAAVQIGEVGDAKAIGKDISMHVVFAKPTYLTRDEVPQELVQKEMEIAQERLKQDPKNANKPPEILAKISQGQMGKFYSIIVLPDQPYYRENSKTVGAHLKSLGAEVKGFKYLKVGP